MVMFIKKMYIRNIGNKKIKTLQCKQKNIILRLYLDYVYNHGLTGILHV